MGISNVFEGSRDLERLLLFYSPFVTMRNDAIMASYERDPASSYVEAPHYVGYCMGKFKMGSLPLKRR